MSISSLVNEYFTMSQVFQNKYINVSYDLFEHVIIYGKYVLTLFCVHLIASLKDNEQLYFSNW